MHSEIKKINTVGTTKLNSLCMKMQACKVGANTCSCMHFNIDFNSFVLMTFIQCTFTIWSSDPLIGFQPWSTSYGVTFFSRDAQLATSLLGFKNFSLSTDSKRVDIGNGA